LMLDVYNNFHPIDFVTRQPLGTMEFRDSLLGKHAKSHLAPNGPGRPGYTDLRKARDYYRRGVHQWYLIWGNAVFSFDSHPLVHGASRISGSLGQFVGTLVGAHPTIRVVPTERNGALIRQLSSLRSRLRLSMASVAGLSALFVLQAVTGMGPGGVAS